MSTDQYMSMIEDEWKQYSKNELYPNVMLLGATGCGKSSLVNLVFGRSIAFVNDADRGTTGFDTYMGREIGIGVNLIDSRGYEMEDNGAESFDRYERDIRTEMDKSARSNPDGKIHVVWYCISVAGERLQEYDIRTLEMLLTEPDLRGRVAVVLTKCDEDDEDGGTARTFRDILARRLPAAVPSFETSTLPDLPLDLDKLISWTSSQLDSKDLREAFVASQVRDLDLKRDTARKAIYGYDAAAAGIGAIPIPISDAALLTPLQVTMAAHVTRIYGLDSFGTLSTAMLGDVVVANLGRSLAGGIIKLIPGVGKIVGGAINATVAVSLTHAIGYAISTICYNCCQRMLDGEKVDFASLFNVEQIREYTRQFLDRAKQKGK